MDALCHIITQGILQHNELINMCITVEDPVGHALSTVLGDWLLDEYKEEQQRRHHTTQGGATGTTEDPKEPFMTSNTNIDLDQSNPTRNSHHEGPCELCKGPHNVVD